MAWVRDYYGRYYWVNNVYTAAATTGTCSTIIMPYTSARLFAQEQVRQQAAFEGHAEAASALADGLLMEHLTPEQRECFQRNRWFVVEGGKSKTKYRIRAKDNLVANIDVLRGPGYGEGISHRLCAHADPKAMPLGDHLLAQKMMIEFAEENFLRIANRHVHY